MDAHHTPLELLQARSRLKKLLPLLHEEEDGFLPFSYPALEGFLFALELALFEIDIGIWGTYLDQFLPPESLKAETLVGDIIIVHTEIQDAVDRSQYFKAHTLSVPPTLSGQNPVEHPVYHWKTGFLTGYSLIEEQLKDVSKSLKKSKRYRTARDAFQKAVMNTAIALDIKIKEDTELQHPDSQNLLSQPLFNRPLNEFLHLSLETLVFAGDLFTDVVNSID